MPFISYARNSEDVLLWRAFNGVGAGFYVDVGAAHPDENSATRAFHDRGWRGINIEPVPDMARRIAAARPRDVTLALAASSGGILDLHVVPGSGLSAADLAASMLGEAGFRTEPPRVPARRLASVLDDYAPEEVHFLRISVGGVERAVLEGCDFGAHRPRVVLVEATRPMSPVPSYEAWEALLTGAGYRFVFFDGLNRFYVADEWAAALAPHFSVPANVRDDYVRVSDAAWARRAAAQDAAVAREAARALAAEDAARAAYARAFEHARDLGLERVAAERAQQDADGLRRALHAREQDILAQQAHLAAAEQDLDAATRLLDPPTGAPRGASPSRSAPCPPWRGWPARPWPMRPRPARIRRPHRRRRLPLRRPLLQFPMTSPPRPSCRA